MKLHYKWKAIFICVVAIVGLVGILSVPYCVFFGGWVPNYVPVGIFLILSFSNFIMNLQ